MRYTSLQINERRLFNPSDKNDLLELKHFIETNRWTGKCPFYLEDSWDNIPAMCMQKYTEHMLRQIKKPSVRKQKGPK
jgi:hypothetical protein